MKCPPPKVNKHLPIMSIPSKLAQPSRAFCEDGYFTIKAAAAMSVLPSAFSTMGKLMPLTSVPSTWVPEVSVYFLDLAANAPKRGRTPKELKLVKN